jgi:hypothetical protein
MSLQEIQVDHSLDVWNKVFIIAARFSPFATGLGAAV